MQQWLYMPTNIMSCSSTHQVDISHPALIAVSTSQLTFHTSPRRLVRVAGPAGPRGARLPGAPQDGAVAVGC